MNRRAHTHHAYGRRSTARATTRTIQDLACSAIRRGLDDESVLIAVHLAFPKAETTLACIRWYRSLLNINQRAA